MAGPDNLMNNGRVSLGDPSECEECRVHAGIGKHLEYAVNISFDAAFSLIPSLSINHARESLNLKIILNVDGQRVGAGGRDVRHWPRRPGDEINGCICWRRHQTHVVVRSPDHSESDCWKARRSRTS